MIVGQFAESDADKDMAQKLLDILYATEDGFAIPEEENGMPAQPEEFWAIFPKSGAIYSNALIRLSLKWHR